MERAKDEGACSKLLAQYYCQQRLALCCATPLYCQLLCCKTVLWESDIAYWSKVNILDTTVIFSLWPIVGHCCYLGLCTKNHLVLCYSLLMV